MPIECCTDGAALLVLEAPVDAGDGVRRAGTELEDGAHLLPAGHRLRPVDVGPLVAAGVTRVRVRAVRVGVVPTGGELVPPGATPGPGESVASNPVSIRALLAPQGAETVVHPVVPDDPAAVRAAIEALHAEVDLVVVCGGSGRGTRDVAFGVVRSLGEVVVDGVAARPGRAFLVVRAGTVPVVAMPGRAQPVGLLTEFFIVPLLAAWGLPAGAAPRVRARLGLANRVASRVRRGRPALGGPGRDPTSSASGSRGGGAERSLSSGRTRASLVPEGVAGYAAGDEVDVELLDDPGGPDRTLLVVGAVEGLDLPATGYRVTVVPCSEDEARELLGRSACHLAVLTATRNVPGPARYAPARDRGGGPARGAAGARRRPEGPHGPGRPGHREVTRVRTLSSPAGTPTIPKHLKRGRATVRPTAGDRPEGPPLQRGALALPETRHGGRTYSLAVRTASPSISSSHGSRLG